MEKGSVGDMTSCDFDLHEVEEPIGARDRYASHTRRYMKLHPPCSAFFPVSLSLLLNVRATLTTPFVLSAEITITVARSTNRKQMD